MEFVPLRSLQRGLPEVWKILTQENGRIVLTNKGQPAFLLIDLADQNVISLINWYDYYRLKQKRESDGQANTSNQRNAASQFIEIIKAINEDGMTADDDLAFDKLESGKYKAQFHRELDL